MDNQADLMRSRGQDTKSPDCKRSKDEDLRSQGQKSRHKSQGQEGMIKLSRGKSSNVKRGKLSQFQKV